jgi:selT/selW/selH-like putative selenoprotein
VAELQARYGDEVQTSLVVGKSGVFEVVLDGKKIYSKKDTGAFPRYGEIPLAIDMKLANS